jgi:hypothetical protein
MMDTTKKKPLTTPFGKPAKSANNSNSVNNTNPAKLSSNMRQGQALGRIVNRAFVLNTPPCKQQIQNGYGLSHP